MDCSQIPHYMMYHIVAQELAQHPEYQDNVEYQCKVCQDFGIPLEDMTDDEIKFLSNLVEQYYYKGV